MQQEADVLFFVENTTTEVLSKGGILLLVSEAKVLGSFLENTFLIMEDRDRTGKMAERQVIINQTARAFHDAYRSIRKKALQLLHNHISVYYFACNTHNCMNILFRAT